MISKTRTGNFQGPKLIRAAALLQTVYASIEIIDCFAAVLMALGLLRNLYPVMLFPEIQDLFDHQSVWLIPLFLFYTTLRAFSAYGLWKNRLWGFWMALCVSAATLMMAPFLFPFTAVEMLLNAGLLIVLLIGYFGKMPIHEIN